MGNAKEIAERLDYLGGMPTTKPTPIEIGKNDREMLQINKKAEEDAITLYKAIVRLTEKEGDIATANLFTNILAEDEDRHNTFSTLMEE